MTSPHRPRRLFVVDTVTTIVFFTLVASLTELLLAGMEPREVLMTRLLTVPVMVLTARPYGAWRDWVFARIAPAGRVGRTSVDMLAFVSFQVPVYAVTLLVAGADLTEMMTALSSAIVFMILLSRPFGLVLDRMRRLAGVSANSVSRTP